MADQVGEKLPDLNRGATVVATIAGDRYEGEVTDINRTKCKLNQGFMESGGIAVYLKLTAETVSRYDCSTGNIRIIATENVPYDWDVPTASLYDQDENERMTQLGEVTELAIRDEQ